MKKRLVAVLMTAAMVCSMGSVSAVSVFAEEETAEAAGDEDVVYVDPLEAEDGLPFAATELSKGKTIGVSVQTHANAFFLAEIDGVKATLEKGGIDAEVIAPDPANDINTQVEDITQMVARGVDVIFVDALDKDGIKPALQEAEDAQSIMESFLQTYPDVKGVFAINSPTAQGAAAAIKAAGLEGKISVVDIDGAQNDIDMIKEGQILCSPVQFPKTIANKAMECAELIWAGKEDEVAKHYYVSGDNITEENLDQYDGNTY